MKAAGYGTGIIALQQRIGIISVCCAGEAGINADSIIGMQTMYIITKRWKIA